LPIRWHTLISWTVVNMNAAPHKKVNYKNNAPYRRQAEVDTMALGWPRCKTPRLSQKTIRLFLRAP
jgi:hypothetical protein